MMNHNKRRLDTITKICSKCKRELSANEFYIDKHKKDGLKSECKKCSNTYCKKYYKQNKKYRLYYFKRYRQEHREQRIACTKKWQENNPEKYKKLSRKQAARRRRELGYNELYENPFADSVKIEWHHIDNGNVVALPTWLHRAFNGYSRVVHRELLKPFIEQIYGSEYVII